jgi:hypothetical protein
MVKQKKSYLTEGHGYPRCFPSFDRPTAHQFRVLGLGVLMPHQVEAWAAVVKEFGPRDLLFAIRSRQIQLAAVAALDDGVGTQHQGSASREPPQQQPEPNREA